MGNYQIGSQLLQISLPQYCYDVDVWSNLARQLFWSHFSLATFYIFG
jgi:hypothetical protein